MNFSVYILFIIISVTTFLQVECGKVALKKNHNELNPVVTIKNEVLENVKATPEIIITETEDKTIETRGPLKPKVGVSHKTIENGTATFSITVSNDSVEDAEHGNSKIVEQETDGSLVAKPRPGAAYFTQLQSLMSQFLTFMGFRSKVERTHRGLDFDTENNEIGNYRDGLRTTIGAVMGRSECYRKATCRAGKYLKTIKGKEFIIIILEKLSPSSWMETVRMLKDSTIYNDECEYKCLEG